MHLIQGSQLDSSMDIYKFLLICGALLTSMMAYISWQRRQAPGAISLTVMLLSSTWWLICYALPLANMVEAKTEFLRAQLVFPSAVLLPPTMLVFVLTYTGKVARLRAALLAALAAEPVIVLTAIWLPDLHDAFYGEAHGRVEDGVFHGPLYWLHSVYTYCVVTLALVLLGKYYKNGSVIRRHQTVYVFYAFIIPVICNLSFALGLLPANVDFTPLGLVISGTLISLALFRRGLLDLVVLAREKIANVIPDGFIIVDAKRRIVDANPAIRILLALPRCVVCGNTLKDELPELDQHVPDRATAVTVVELDSIDGKHLELRFFAISDDTGEVGGHLLIVRDITEAKTNALALQNANAELRNQLAKIEEMQSLLREQAVRDPLTGLYNRRFLDEVLSKQVSLSARSKSIFAVVMIDIDYFKSINDRYGHAAGDTILQSLSTLLSHRSRAGDIVCRYGGEEFAVIMCGSSIEDAVRRVEEWRAEFAALCHAFDGDDVARTFSAGAATYPADGSDAETLLKSADTALYAAKAAGRNLVKRAVSKLVQDERATRNLGSGTIAKLL